MLPPQGYPIPKDSYYMAGGGGQRTIIIPSREMVVVRLGHFRGAGPGDKALKKTADNLKDCIRKNDMLFRYGGDEFIILLTSQNEDRLRTAQARVLAKIDRLSKAGLQENSDKRGFSFGNASGPAAEAKELFRLADKDMYGHKKPDKGSADG